MDTPQDGTSSDDFATIPDVPIPLGNSSISNPNQVRSGVGRGAPIINYGADGNPQVLQGSQATFGNGFYVAQTGKDVTTITDPADFIFNSNQDVFKIVKTGSSSISMTDGTLGSITRVTIPHNLGFIPIPMVFINLGGQFYQPIPTFTASDFDTTNNFIRFHNWIAPTVSDTNLFIDGYNASPGISLTYQLKYYLLQETIAVS